MVPLLLSLWIGYAVGNSLSTPAMNARELVSLVEDEGGWAVRVPVEAWEIAWDGRAPESTSPWGESHEAATVAPVRGSRIVLYSPFSVAPESSADFIALQLSRAVKAVYKREIPPEEIGSRYFEIEGTKLVGLRTESLTLAKDYGLSFRAWGPGFPVLMLLIAALGFPVLAASLRTLRADVTQRRKNTVYWGLLMTLLALYLCVGGLMIAGVVDDLAAGGFLEILFRTAGALPGGTVLVWVACAAGFALLYRMAEREFLRVESLPGDDAKGGFALLAAGR
jgi:hypothetical protein